MAVLRSKAQATCEWLCKQSCSSILQLSVKDDKLL